MNNFLYKLFVLVIFFPLYFLQGSPVIYSYCLISIFSSYLIIKGFNVTGLLPAFLAPWLFIVFFSVLPISEYSREIDIHTIKVISLMMLISVIFLPSDLYENGCRYEVRQFKRKSIQHLFVFFILFSFLNVLLAGYVPVIRMILGDGSGYMDFGVKGVYGVFNAFSNALGLTAFYIWLKTKDKFFLHVFLVVLFVFLLFVTRQNIISLLVESFVLYNCVVRRISLSVVLPVIIVFLLLFGLIGDVRVGRDIYDLAAIKDDYKWLPSWFIWLYSYSYFNVLNLDNTVLTYSIPLFDFSSFATLIPSFLRPGFDDNASILEISSFTVGTFMLPIYRDLGDLGLLFLFSSFCLLGRYFHKKLMSDGEFFYVAGYSVIYFCFLFSFFENFWFYLPVIFQIPFFLIFKLLFMKPIMVKGAR